MEIGTTDFKSDNSYKNYPYPFAVLLLLDLKEPQIFTSVMELFFMRYCHHWALVSETSLRASTKKNIRLSDLFLQNPLSKIALLSNLEVNHDHTTHISHQNVEIVCELSLDMSGQMQLETDAADFHSKMLFITVKSGSSVWRCRSDTDESLLSRRFKIPATKQGVQHIAVCSYSVGDFSDSLPRHRVQKKGI